MIEKIKEYMFKNDLTGEQIAKLIGISRSTLFYVLWGDIPSERTKYKIDAFLKNNSTNTNENK